MTKAAEPLPLTGDDHHPDDAHLQIIDVTGLLLDLDPELLAATRGGRAILRPAPRPTNPSFIPTPDADDSWGEWNNSHYSADHHRGTARPRSPVGPPPPDPPSNPPAETTAPIGAVSFRVPDGESENSDAAEAFSISQFDKNDIELVNLWKLPMTHIVYDASPSWTPVTQYPSA